MTKLVLIGASGHGKVAADIAELSGQYQQIVFYDAKYPTLTQVEHWPVVGKDIEQIDGNTHYFVAVGDNAIRARLFNQLIEHGATFATLVHPSAVVSRYATIGQGTLVCAGATINPFTQIGDNCIINTQASVDHDGKIADHVHIAPGVHIAGTVSIGQGSFIGIGSCVIPNLHLGNQVQVGAGATVVTDLPDRVLAYGTPARIKE